MVAQPERNAGLLDPEQHPAALERAALASLTRGDLDEAFRFADRRCRILPVAQARHYTLRAEIAYRSGFAAAALKDITKALELAPDDLSANRRMMQWGEDEQRTSAARRLIELDRDMNVLGEAVALLKARGETALGAIHRVGDGITGWAIWQGRGIMNLRIDNGRATTSYPVQSDPQHILAGKAEHAASFKAPFPATPMRRVVSLTLGGRNVVRSAFPPPLAIHPVGHDREIKAKRGGAAKKSAVDVTVIVPVYDDLEATRRCLGSLMSAISDDDRVRVILVDDATPDERIASHLDQVAASSNVKLIRNPDNLGFIGAVNRALGTVSSGDVILLNSDTVVPKGFAKRLRDAAHAAPDIGTVTPLSNNGEATSLPLAFAANPLPSVKDVARLDRIAARVNSGRVVDMPDGIGFCLYITRACLDAVGGLSDHYHRGYLEDVDLCLRARQHGFRNVCATSVYVGHAGSASFKSEKRALVVLNLARLRLRFPNYRNESATFMALDPVKQHRGAIERELLRDRKGTAIVLSGDGAVSDVAKQFAAQSDQPAILAILSKDGTRIALRDAGSAFPQSLDFELPAEGSELVGALSAVAPSRMVVADPARLSIAFVRSLVGPGTVIDLLVADAGLWCSRGGLDRNGHLCAALLDSEGCTCGRSSPDDWIELLTRDSRILAPCKTARAFSMRRLPSKISARIRLVESAAGSEHVGRPNEILSRSQVLGVLPAGLSARDFAFMRDVIRHIRQQNPKTRIVVMGETVDDLALMSLGNLMVTGPVSAEDLPGAAEVHGLGGIFIARPAPLFGHPLIETAFSKVSVPLAFFDWSFGKVRRHEADLPMTPSNNAAIIARSVLGWSAPPW